MAIVAHAPARPTSAVLDAALNGTSGHTAITSDTSPAHCAECDVTWPCPDLVDLLIADLRQAEHAAKVARGEHLRLVTFQP